MQNQMFAEARARAMTSEADAANMAASYQAHLQAGAPSLPSAGHSTTLGTAAASGVAGSISGGKLPTGGPSDS
eukprot:360622-Chlamydomonas_euryale.AAC.11